METSDLVLSRGLRDTRATLARWGRQPTWEVHVCPYLLQAASPVS